MKGNSPIVAVVLDERARYKAAGGAGGRVAAGALGFGFGDLGVCPRCVGD